jgi:hypothetical protein
VSGRVVLDAEGQFLALPTSYPVSGDLIARWLDLPESRTGRRRMPLGDLLWCRVARLGEPAPDWEGRSAVLARSAS